MALFWAIALIGWSSCRSKVSPNQRDGKTYIWLVVWNCFFHIGNVITPTNEHIFQRGRFKPPTRHSFGSFLSPITRSPKMILAKTPSTDADHPVSGSEPKCSFVRSCARSGRAKQVSAVCLENVGRCCRLEAFFLGLNSEMRRHWFTTSFC